MRLATLSSGSSGNAVYIGTERRNILVDAGISFKRIKEGLETLGLVPEDLDAIFITHEHSDHISGLGVLLRKCHLPVYLTEGTYDYIKRCRSLGALPEDCFRIIKPGAQITCADLNVCAIASSHDAAEPVIYRFDCKERSAAVVTDLGCYDDKIIAALDGLDAMVLEANHDVRMLEVGPYTYELKTRILSSDGHLSNELAGQLLARIYSPRLKHVLLGHISEHNNYPQLALEAVGVEAAFAGIPRDILDIAPRNKISEIYEL